MRQTSFEHLTINEKAGVVLEEGTYISTAEFAGVDIMLYRHADEFVEIWYNHLSKKIEKVEPLGNRTINPLLKHLSGFNLN